MYFKANYKQYKKATDFTNGAKATLTYIATRKGIDGEKKDRLLFGWNPIEKAEALERIAIRSQMKPLRLWRMILSSDIVEENPNKDLDLYDLARKTLDYIREKIDPNIEFIFAEHTDHSEIPHVQGLVFFKGRLELDDLERMRTLAHEYALSQQVVREQAKEFFQNLQQVSQKSYHPSIDPQSTSYRPVGVAGGRAHRVRHYQSIPPCPDGGIHQMVKLSDGKFYCPVHEKVHERSSGLSL